MEAYFPVELLAKYGEQISTLPKRDDWKFIGTHYQYQGFWYLMQNLGVIMAAQDHFQAAPTDLIVSSYPKTGTTWIKALTLAILKRNQFNDASSPFQEKLPHELIPFLEFDFAKIPQTRDPQIQPVATHMPYSSLPKSIIDASCKIVYICREPKDTFVSGWHFLNKLVPQNPLTKEEVYELFCEGVYNYGHYADHVLSYWKASLEYPDRVFFVKYEDLKSEPLLHVKRLAEFLGRPFTAEEEKDGVVQKVIDVCSFEKLSNLDVNKTGQVSTGASQAAIDNSAFFRKGSSGGWMNELTPEMGARLDKIMEDKLSGSGLTFKSS